MKNLSKYKKNISFFCPINKLSGGGGAPKRFIIIILYYVKVLY